MGSEPTNFAPLRFSTSDLPERDRLPFWREVFSRKIVNVDVEPRSDHPFHAEATLLAWPGLRTMWSNTSRVAQWRTRDMPAESEVAFVVKQDGHFSVSQQGADVLLGQGDAVGFLHAEPTIATWEDNFLTLVVPCAALAPFVRDIQQAAMRLIPQENEALRLLTKYVGILREDPALTTPELRYLIVTHIHDLVATALGATRDGVEIAKGRGMRAARLRAIKTDILENLGSDELTVTALALRQRVTPRYIHKLFETEGITFAEFVLEHRLGRAHRTLSDPGRAGSTISAIAFEVGFGDLSYFNRTFRRHFGVTPSELRHRLSGVLGVEAMPRQ